MGSRLGIGLGFRLGLGLGVLICLAILCTSEASQGYLLRHSEVISCPDRQPWDSCSMVCVHLRSHMQCEAGAPRGLEPVTYAIWDRCSMCGLNSLMVAMRLRERLCWPKPRLLKYALSAEVCMTSHCMYDLRLHAHQLNDIPLRV